MFAAIREYKLRPGTVDELEGKIRNEFVPLITGISDLVSYTVVIVGDDDLVTTSVFESQAGAEESVKLAGEWVRNTLQAFVVGTPRVTTGEITVRFVNEAAKAGFGVMRRFACTSESAVTITTRVREGLVPILSATPGLATFGLFIAAGQDRGGASLSACVDRATAEAANTQSLAWIKENVADLLSAPPEIFMGEIVLRHTRSAVGTF